jgi:hypothetical protein
VIRFKVQKIFLSQDSPEEALIIEVNRNGKMRRLFFILDENNSSLENNLEVTLNSLMKEYFNIDDADYKYIPQEIDED